MKQTTTSQSSRVKMAAKLLNEITVNTTDATAFLVRIEKDFANEKNLSITLNPDMKRRNIDGPKPYFLGATFYHMAQVVDICRALGLGSWISADYMKDSDEIFFEVHIH